jgi:hypothetical protein
MKRILFLAVLSTFLVACDKVVFSSTGTGTIRISNSSNEKYNIYIVSKLIKELPGHSTHEETVGKGLYTVRAEQTSGIVDTPKVYKTNIVIESGLKEFRFP